MSGVAVHRASAAGRAILNGALIVACTLVVVLARQVGTLRAQRNDLNTRMTQPHSGMYVPSFQTTSLDSRRLLVGQSTDSNSQVLFIFTTTCPYCVASLRAWNAIADSLGGAHLVVGITLSPLQDTRRYATNHGLRFPVVAFPTDREARLYRAGRVPVTMVVNPDGRVPWARVGQLSDQPGVDSLLEAVRSGRPPGVPGRR